MLTAHMVEHEFLMVAAAPLLVLSRPLTAFLWALPIGARRWLGTLAAAPPIAALWIALTNATVAMLIHVTTIFAWHTPSLFDAAISNPFCTSSSTRRFWDGAPVLVGDIEFAEAPVRSGCRASLCHDDGHVAARRAPHAYAEALVPELFGAAVGLHSRSRTSSLPGLVMWIPGCSVYAIAALVFLAVWIAASGRHELQLAKIEVLPTG
jgi:cytochrome c oxidase assembly factor CtaG